MATYYINADTGNDSTGDGSSGSPWLLLSKAHTEAASGDTIICQDSTATYAFTNQIFTKDLTVEGEQVDASGAVFDGNNAEVYWVHDSVDLILSKLTFTNANAADQSCLLGSNGATTGASLSISQCVFHNLVL